MKRFVLPCVALVAAVVFSGCSSMYIPNAGNVPLLNEKGDVQVDASLATNALQLAGNYAITDHVAAMAAGSLSYGNFTNSYDIYTSKSHDSTTFDLTHWGRFNNRQFEFGAGYYNICNREHLKLEAFAGVGFNFSDDVDDFKKNRRVEYTSDYVMPFVQLNTGFTFKYCDFGLAFRVDPTFHTFKWAVEDASDPSLNGSHTAHFAMWHLEPLAFLRVGSEHVKFVAKAGFSAPLEGQSYNNVSDEVPNNMYTKTTLFHLSLGVCVNLNTAKN